SCLANHYASVAIADEIPVKSLRIAALAHFDRVLVGGAFRDVTYDVRIDSDEPEERIRALAERAEEMCFASNTLSNAGALLTTKVPVKGTLIAPLTRPPA